MNGVYRLQRRSTLWMVLVVSVVALLIASVLVVVGTRELLDVDSEGSSTPLSGRLLLTGG